MAILAECPVCHRQQKVSNKYCAGCGQSMDKFKNSGKVRYLVSVRGPDGKQIRKSVGQFKGLKARSIKDANKAEAAVKTQKEEKRPLFNMAPGSDVTFNDLTEWYLTADEVTKLKSAGRIGIILAHFCAVHGGLLVNDINLDYLNNFRKKRKADGCADRTVDYEVSVIKTMVTRAFYYDKIDGRALKPFKVFKPLLGVGDNARDRMFTCEEYLGLLEHAPRHLRGIIVTAFHTGMRKGEILKLTWPMVDRKRAMIRLPKGYAKNKRPRSIPINHHVAAVLESLPRAIAHNYVFTYRGRNLTDRFGRSFKSTCESAAIPYGRKTDNGVVFHDLRRTCKTNMLAAGVDKTYRDLIVGHALTGMDASYINNPPDEHLTRSMARFTDWIDGQLEKANVVKSVMKSIVY